MASAVLAELALATLMVLLTVAIHGTGLVLLGRALRVEAREEAAEHIDPLSARGVGFTLVLVIGLFILHGIEIWLYGLLYYLLGAVETFRSAIYFSTITYGAIGYDDAAMADHWRLVSAIEGINGVLLIGWSTAFFVTVVTRVRRR